MLKAKAAMKGYGNCGWVAESGRKVMEEMWYGYGYGYAEEDKIDGCAEEDKIDVVWRNGMIAAYAHKGEIEKAVEVFGRISIREKNVVTWTAMISGYAQNGYYDEALELFHEMQAFQLPNHFTFATILPTCHTLKALKEIHQQIIRRAFNSNLFVGNGLLHVYAKFGRIEIARDMFDKMPHRNVVSWTSMLAGYAQNGMMGEAVRLFSRMPERNLVSWNAMIGGYMQNGLVDEAHRLFEQMPPSERNTISWTTMIAGFADNRRIEEAMKVFWEMPVGNRNTVSWNTIIAGYAETGKSNEALKLFQEMLKTGNKPNSHTFAVVVPLYANLGGLKQGKEIHDFIIRLGFGCNVFASTSLVDMYAKCGSIQDAHTVFDQIQMLQRDVVTWSTMITGYAMHGYGKEALQVFQQMLNSGTNKPDHVTFVGVLSACAQQGLVDEGWHYFDSMSKQYGIIPTMEHYGCMVDLLGRAGQFNEAQHFINKMPIKPDATVWACMLGACKNYTKIELGEYVAQVLFQLDPENPAPYVQLSNIYAATGRWNGIERVRELMKDRRFKKKPGCSWIEVNKQVHIFFSI